MMNITDRCIPYLEVVTIHSTFYEFEFPNPGRRSDADAARDDIEDTTVQDAARRVPDEELSALVVTTHLPSIITSTDVISVAADGRNAGDVPVTDVMTESVETVP